MVVGRLQARFEMASGRETVACLINDQVAEATNTVMAKKLVLRDCADKFYLIRTRLGPLIYKDDAFKRPMLKCDQECR